MEMKINGDQPHQGMLYNFYFCVNHLCLSMMELNLSAIHSSIGLYSGWDYTEFASLVHIPIRSVTECYKLNNIITAGNKLHGSHVNLLVAVKNVSCNDIKVM